MNGCSHVVDGWRTFLQSFCLLYLWREVTQGCEFFWYEVYHYREGRGVKMFWTVSDNSVSCYLFPYSYHFWCFDCLLCISASRVWSGRSSYLHLCTFIHRFWCYLTDQMDVSAHHQAYLIFYVRFDIYRSFGNCFWLCLSFRCLDLMPMTCWRCRIFRFYQAELFLLS